jgi:hypothetical protein
MKNGFTKFYNESIRKNISKSDLKIFDHFNHLLYI